jgi:KR domain/Phosphopantetheine attachment site
VRAADVSKPAEVDAVVSAIAATARPLRGVIHAAGVRADRLLLQDDWGAFQAVLAPKIQGTWNLHRATSGMQLDFFVCFASVSGLLGATGQSSYAAANAFMDSFAHYRQSLGLPGCAIDWGMWAEGGMAADMDSRARRNLIRRGMGLLPPDMALACLKFALHSGRAQIAALLIDWESYAREFPAGCVPSLLPGTRFNVRPPAAATPGNWRQHLLAAAPGDCERRLYQYLEQEVRAGLGLPEGHVIDPRRGFAELGMDSILSVELRDRLCAELEVMLPATVVFEHPTLETLTLHLLSQIIGEALPIDRSKPAAAAEAFDVRSFSERELEALVDREWTSITGGQR